MTEVQATIQALAIVESLTNNIDTLAVLDLQVKDLNAKCKVLKDRIANQYGEGDRKSTRLNSSHIPLSRMPSSA